VTESEKKCEPGYMYSVDVDMCLIARKPSGNSIPLESDSLIAENPILEITSFSNSPKNGDDCPTGTMFSPELGICSKISNGRGPFQPLPALNLVSDVRPVAPLEITAFNDQVQTGDDCSPSQIYMAELDICVEKTPSRLAPVIRPQSASLTKDEFVPNTPQQTSVECKDDEFFMSEIGICIQLPNSQKVKKPASDSLIRVTPAPVAPKVAFEESVRCGTGETFNPSLGICMTLPSTQNVQSPPPSSSLIKEPETLEITSFKGGNSFSDCQSQGKFYIAELDICA